MAIDCDRWTRGNYKIEVYFVFLFLSTDQEPYKNGLQFKKKKKDHVSDQLTKHRLINHKTYKLILGLFFQE